MADRKVTELINKYKSTATQWAVDNLNRSKLEDHLRLDLDEKELKNFLMNFYTEKDQPMSFAYYYDAVRAIKTIYGWIGNPAADNIDEDLIAQEYYIHYNQAYGLDHIVKILDQIIDDNYRDLKLKKYYKLLIRLMSAGMMLESIVAIRQSDIDSIANTITVNGVTYYVDMETIDLLQKVLSYPYDSESNYVFGNPAGYDFPVYMSQKLYQKILSESDPKKQLTKTRTCINRSIMQLNESYKYFPLNVQFLRKVRMYQDLVDAIGLENARFVCNPKSYKFIPPKAKEALLTVAKKYNVQSDTSFQLRSQLEFVCW